MYNYENKMYRNKYKIMIDKLIYMSIISIVRMIKNSYRLDDNLIIKRKEGRK